MRFRKAAYQTQLFGVSRGNLGHILGDDTVELGSRMMLGPEVRNVAAVKDHLGNGADRSNTRNDQADNP